VTDDFRPGPVLRSRHLQSVLAAAGLQAPPRGFAPESSEDLHVPLPGGAGLLARAWWHPHGRARDTALLVHGVAGSSESRYLLRAAVLAYRAGLHVVRLNLRGVGEGAALAPTFYHAGLTEDPKEAIAVLSSRAEVGRIHLVGFSLGGATALLCATEWAARPPDRIATVSAVSPPLDLATASRHNERLAALPYRWYIVSKLREMVLGQHARFPNQVRIDVGAARRARTVWEFDDAIVAPHHGFRGAADYYATVSPGSRLDAIRVPTMVVHADDDPIVSRTSVVPWLHRAQGRVRFVRTAHGGHVAFAPGIFGERLLQSWAMERVLEFAREA
jgi:hypothetical protein